jgi:hypothetical protein
MVSARGMDTRQGKLSGKVKVLILMVSFLRKRATSAKAECAEEIQAAGLESVYAVGAHDYRTRLWQQWSCRTEYFAVNNVDMRLPSCRATTI